MSTAAAISSVVFVGILTRRNTHVCAFGIARHIVVGGRFRFVGRKDGIDGLHAMFVAFASILERNTGFPLKRF